MHRAPNDLIHEEAVNVGNAVFAQRLKAERNKKGISMDALAKALGVNKSRVGMWETNGILPRQDALLRLCKFFNVTADYLLGNDGQARNAVAFNAIQRRLMTFDETQLKRVEELLNAEFDEAFGGKGE